MIFFYTLVFIVLEVESLTVTYIEKNPNKTDSCVELLSVPITSRENR